MSRTRQALRSLGRALEEVDLAAVALDGVRALVAHGLARQQIVEHGRALASALFDDHVADNVVCDERLKQIIDRWVHRKLDDLVNKL